MKKSIIINLCDNYTYMVPKMNCKKYKYKFIFFDFTKILKNEKLIGKKFKGQEFETFENEAGKHSFYMSPQNG